jgi:pyridoxine 5-phosphate synthase
VTKLSVNINKIALLRNSRGRNFPDVRAFAARCLDLGAHGITLHPRQDQRHARYSDVDTLSLLCQERGVELNVEAYPCEEFLAVVKRAKPAQCTLVPDAPGQLTSDHGWQIAENESLLRGIIKQLHDEGIRVSLFMDVDSTEFALAKEIGADRIELYTEPYAELFAEQTNAVHSPALTEVLESFRRAASQATQLGLGVNAGHDLNLDHLGLFLSIGNILEVSIGHALIVECLEMGVAPVISGYVELVNRDSKSSL